MATEASDELLVTIAPAAGAAPAVPEYHPWLGPLLIIGAPVGLAFVVFALISSR